MTSDLAHPLEPARAEALVGGYYSTPFDLLGMHRLTVDGMPGIVVRTFQPQALTVAVEREGRHNFGRNEVRAFLLSSAVFWIDQYHIDGLHVDALNRHYRSQPALHKADFSWEGFQWIAFHDVDGSVVSFVRRAKDPSNFVVVVANFTPVPRHSYPLGVPAAGYYRELMNGDSVHFGGSNVGNADGLFSNPVAWHGQPYSILLSLPPLAVLFFKPEPSLPADNSSL